MFIKDYAIVIFYFIHEVEKNEDLSIYLDHKFIHTQVWCVCILLE